MVPKRMLIVLIGTGVKILGHLHTFCMHVMDTAVFASLHSKKGSTCLPGKKIGKYCCVCFSSPICAVVVLSVERARVCL